MKKILFVAAIALCAMSCGKKEAKTEACTEEAPAAVEVVEAQEEAVVEEAPAEVVEEAAAEVVEEAAE